MGDIFYMVKCSHAEDEARYSAKEVERLTKIRQRLLCENRRLRAKIRDLQQKKARRKNGKKK